MLRALAFSLLGLSLLAGSAAARGGDGPSGGRRAAVAKAGGAKADRGASPLLRRVAFGRPAVAAAGACARTGRSSAARCRAGAVPADTVRGWASGLPPALGVQAQACPADTMATLAEGHDDIVRCMPI